MHFKATLLLKVSLSLSLSHTHTHTHTNKRTVENVLLLTKDWSTAQCKFVATCPADTEIVLLLPVALHVRPFTLYKTLYFT